jgi:hypothetical protein
MIDNRASPTRKGHHLVGVLAVHVGAIELRTAPQLSGMPKTNASANFGPKLFPSQVKPTPGSAQNLSRSCRVPVTGYLSRSRQFG